MFAQSQLNETWVCQSTQVKTVAMESLIDVAWVYSVFCGCINSSECLIKTDDIWVKRTKTIDSIC
jgi:hypothetical protein